MNTTDHPPNRTEREHQIISQTQRKAHIEICRALGSLDGIHTWLDIAASADRQIQASQLKPMLVPLLEHLESHLTGAHRATDDLGALLRVPEEDSDTPH